MSLSIKTMENYIDLIDENNRIAATVWSFGLSNENKLSVKMAVAEELLESLETLMFCLNSGSIPSPHSLEVANKVIAKAKRE